MASSEHELRPSVHTKLTSTAKNSRISAICSQQIYLDEMSDKQRNCQVLQNPMKSSLNLTLRLKQLLIAASVKFIWCDTSRGFIRPSVPDQFKTESSKCYTVASWNRSNNRAGEREIRLESTNKSIQHFVQHCFPCQKTKVQQQIKSKLNFNVPP